MNIYGENIILRGIEADDNNMLLELINDPETERLLGGSSFPVSEYSQKKWFDSTSGASDTLRLIVAPKNDISKALGTIILSDIDMKNATAQIHIKLSPNGGRGRGYGTDAIKALSKYAFLELRLNCIYAEILEYNAVSRKVFEKCGFCHEGTLRCRVFKNGRFTNVESFSLLKDDIINEK